MFTRTVDLVGADALHKLENSSVIIFGLGGVGGFCAEALARAGIGSLTLVDSDLIEVSNINRQLTALHSTLGRSKVDVTAERIQDINPQARVEKQQIFYLPENSAQFNLAAYSYVIDAVDTVAAKVELAVQCQNLKTRLISCMGAGNKLDPLQFQVTDIYATSICPLCKVMRKQLKKRGVTALKVVYSQEEPMQRSRTPGSISFVPPVAGLIMAGEVIKDLLKG
ncbi:MAG: tRNA threonylcarbamoyladenosine dehydratase [Kiritimatiellae bacterium]|nr:tRNA threonylcarbamoyladenosine dehydratase [Kiritimatiellia bacterium]